MSRMGVRAGASLLAMAAVAAAAVLGTIVLLTTLRSSLIDEIDRSNRSRAEDIGGQWFSENEEIVLGAGFDSFTFAAVFDGTGFYADTDFSSDGTELEGETTAFNEPLEASLTLDDTLGSDNLRALAILADDPDNTDGRTPAELDDEDVIIFVATSLDPVDDTVSQIRLGALILGPLFVALVGALTWFLTGRALQPVEAIRREVEAIHGSDLNRRVPEPGTDDEIGRLATTMNGMLGRLEASQAAQQQFVSDASHELRSPLASMSAILDVSERHGDADEWRSTSADLKRETDRMRRMVDDLLLLARSDAGEPLGLEAERTIVDVDDVIIEAVHLAPPSDGPEVGIDGVGSARVLADRDRLQRVVINLLDNARRHAGSRIEVSLRVDDGVVTLAVDDDGPGVPVEQRSAVFERFVRLDEARSRDRGGSGLGLAISKEIVDAHGGVLTVGDSPLGGARFEVTLPAHQ